MEMSSPVAVEEASVYGRSSSGESIQMANKRHEQFILYNYPQIQIPTHILFFAESILRFIVHVFDVHLASAVVDLDSSS